MNRSQSTIARLIAVQVEDEDLARKARLLNVLAVGLAAAMILFLIATTIYGPTLSSILPIVATLLICGIAYWLNKAAQVQIAAYVLLVGFALVVTMSMLLRGSPPETKTVAPYFYSLCVVAAGVMISPSAGFWLATLDAILLLGVIAVSGGPLAFASSERLESAISVISAPVMLSYILAITSWLFGNSLDQVLQEVRQQAVDLDAQLEENKHRSADLRVQLEKNERLVEQIQNVAEQLAPMAEELAATMEQMNAASEQIAATTSQMSQGAASQAHQTEEAARSAAQLAAATSQIAENARQTGDASTRSQELVQNTVQVVEALETKLGEIERVVALVDKIADQTNLLSLNASIEAARAGEHGAGFAVVADEVRRLAVHSATSVGEIATLSREIGSRLREVLAAMEEAQQGVAHTVSLAQEVGAATGEQRQATEAVVGAINKVASVAEESAAASEEIAASIEEQVASIEQVVSSTQALAELAARLQQTLEGQEESE